MKIKYSCVLKYKICDFQSILPGHRCFTDTYNNSSFHKVFLIFRIIMYDAIMMDAILLIYTEIYLKSEGMIICIILTYT